MRIGVLSTVLLLAACSVEHVPRIERKQSRTLVYDVWVDSAFPFDAMAGVFDAIEDWNASPGLTLHVRMTNHASVVSMTKENRRPMSIFMVRVDGPRDEDCPVPEGAANERGMPQGGYLLCFIDSVPIIGESYWHSIAAHELGHAFGLPHTRDGIMQTPVLNEGTVSCVDRVRLADLHELPAPLCTIDP